MFNNFYGIYKCARNASWNFLIDYQLKEIPINLKAITTLMNIKVKLDKLGVLTPSQKGITVTDGINLIYY